jgi:tRNA A-37 threonylcarbamoyl transferase component Bud32/tetratricopeptide (TPR) repeat protein
MQEIRDTLPETKPGVVPTITEDRLPKLAIGSTLPDTRLQIVRWLGQGGMGVVFEVRHLDIERRFAAKLLNAAKNPARTRRFRDEARTITQIGSPWIVEVFDFKELSDGRLMYVMELVEGPSLSAVVREQGALPLARVLGLARQICKGLHDAHQVGFVHRDVKPENVMLGIDADGREHVKLVDFGLAALLEGPKEANTAGTPAYMSPEQCRGEDSDERTDIYSLGVTLYELACGRLPFDAPDDDDVRRAHLAQQPRPPSRVAADAGLLVPAALDDVLLKCLAKQPRDRYASAAELEAALIEVQLSLALRTDADHLHAPKLDDERRARRLEDGLAALRNAEQQAERRRVMVGVALLALLGLGTLVGWQHDNDARETAQLQAQQEIERLEDRAHAAATHARWVYPSVTDPHADTSYRVVLELERLTVPGAAPAARGLREEFASTLVGLGDRYWDEPAGRQFAEEFYVQALLFAPEHERANARVDISPLRLLELREQAASGMFTPSQLMFIETLDSLVEPDPEQRIAKLERARRRKDISHTTAIAIDDLLADLTTDPVAPVPEPHPSARVPASSDTIAEPEPAPDQPTAAEAEPEPEPDTHAMPASASKQVVDRAQAAYDAGRDDHAAKLFHQALARDRNNVEALVGLHQIAYDRGDYRDALDYAKRALALRPKRGDLALDVGDACMKVLDYACAKHHYETAGKLGDRRASARLELLKERIGK